jgi:hypothetical protein
MRHALLLSAIMCAAASAHAACPATARALKEAKFDVPDHAQRQVLAIGMLDCLSAPDPALRDGIGFEAVQLWARSEKLDTATLQAMHTTLLARLAAPDAQGFGRPKWQGPTAASPTCPRLSAAPFLARQRRGWRPCATTAVSMKKKAGATAWPTVRT